MTYRLLIRPVCRELVRLGLRGLGFRLQDRWVPERPGHLWSEMVGWG